MLIAVIIHVCMYGDHVIIHITLNNALSKLCYWDITRYTLSCLQDIYTELFKY